MLEALTGNITHVVTGFVFIAVLGIAIKKIPAMIEEKARAAVDKLFAAGDAADDVFLIAAIKWAEAKYGPGSGKAKADAVVNKIIALLPVQYRLFVTAGVKAKITELFQASFDRLENVASEAQNNKVG